jgi:hypothetical protein
MLQCSTPGCRVRQHADCLALPPSPQQPYFCDLCRVKAADPFWEVLDTSIMPPARVRMTNRQVQVRCPGAGAGAGAAGVQPCGMQPWGYPRCSAARPAALQLPLPELAR